ncbi:hypothetical protein SAMN05443665_104338 [Actinomadura meyerae]|jgi:hypothetical protein|uniref:Uncharacterized protein n=1 Tax=Actinomadura meyerae TaxID=240840 RepID=A0A239NL38_9ACTN|nr:hypothetical protein [Actinomadura meyerae]SNT55163.1 hypothetical protein SAMN05443665_104338 [Actinomadura meyerae]
MGNSVRWTFVAVLLAINVVVSVAFADTWLSITINAVTGLGIVGLVADYFIRGRRRT